MKIDLIGVTLRPKARPRIGKRGVYSPTKQHETDLAWLLRSQAPGVQFTGTVAVSWEAWGVGKMADIDNCTKTLLDALQKAGIVRNDRQVRETHARIWDDGEPRLTVEIWEI